MDDRTPSLGFVPNGLLEEPRELHDTPTATTVIGPQGQLFG